MNGKHAVVEISLGPGHDDITCVPRWAGILHRATGEQVDSVVPAPAPR